MKDDIAHAANAAVKRMTVTLDDASDVIARCNLTGTARRVTTVADRATEADRPSIMPALDPRHNVNAYGRPEVRRQFTRAQYVALWERWLGRTMTRAEHETLDRGCIGMTMLRLGRTHDEPPLNLAFADTDAHRAIAEAEKFLAPGELANANVLLYRDLLDAAKANPDVSPRRVAHFEKQLAQARTHAAQIWRSMDKNEIRDMREARHDAKIDGGRRTFAKVQQYADKFEAILAAKPADTNTFLKMVAADPELSLLRGVGDQLPPGPPSDWEVVIFAKQFWSGQEAVFDSAGKLVPQSKWQPDETRFAPNPVTRQVDMSGDFHKPKPGHVNFNYAWYDKPTNSWFWADQHHLTADEHGTDSPMTAFQSRPRELYAGEPATDSMVVCLAFASRTTLSTGP